MSADNTIIILKTVDGYRVGHFQAADNLCWAWGSENNEIMCVRVFEFFHDCDSIKSEGDTLISAQRIYNSIGYVEYGIQTIGIDKSFYEICIEARKQALNEIDWISGEKCHLEYGTKKDVTEELKATLEEINNWLENNGYATSVKREK
jgi:hypothetical protein